MDCMHSLAPHDEDLLNYALDGDPLATEQREHLEQCEICQQRLAFYRDTHNFFVARLYRRQCPTGTQLSFYCADMLPAQERLSVAAHVRTCPLCANEVAELRRLTRDFEPF